ncbi:MAG: hypothetical protein ACYTGV_04020 [Planctomycetota bacterium]|jgi:hypothetical protein
MRHQIPVEDPSRRESLSERTATYIRQNVTLRVLLAVTVIDHLAAIALVLTGRLPLSVAGTLALISVMTWFFAVPLPLMNRAIRDHAGVRARSQLGELVETFGRVVLFAITGCYTYLLVMAAVSSSG